ncbi:MAG: transposase [Sulfurovum sp.]|nr:MAG: transposase [Sulfurovum sp.]
MTALRDLHNRCSLRLPHYDYSRAGYYFITICTQNRLHLFGEIVDDMMVLGVAGKMVNKLWYEIINDFPNIALHEFIIMPNHIHGIIEIVDNVGAPLVGALDVASAVGIHDKRAPMKGAPTVGNVIGVYKSLTTNAYIKMVKNGTLPPFDKRIWQRNYYEHIIRDDVDYDRIATYIINNPSTWDDDVLSKN